MPSGRFVKQIDGFLEPSHAIWLPDGNIAVADRMADEVVYISLDGTRLKTTPREGTKRLRIGADGNVVEAPDSQKYGCPRWPTEEVWCVRLSN